MNKREARRIRKTTQDYYAILGVSRTATPDDIHKAYRAIAFKNHPDRNVGDAQAAARFRDATEAYEVLGEASKRQIFDRYHQGQQATDQERATGAAAAAQTQDVPNGGLESEVGGNLPDVGLDPEVGGSLEGESAAQITSVLEQAPGVDGTAQPATEYATAAQSFDFAGATPQPTDVSPAAIEEPLAGAGQPAPSAPSSPGSPGRKKKAAAEKSPDWFKVAGGIGDLLSHVGGATGNDHLRAAGGMLQAGAQFAKLLNVQFGSRGGGKAKGGATEHAAATAGGDDQNLGDVLKEDGAGAGESDQGLGSISGNTLTGMAEGGNATGTTSERATGKGESQQVMHDLLEAVKKLTEAMEKKAGGPNADGNFMPEKGSFGGGGGSGVIGMIGEALGFSPGEIQLIVTMIRMLLMAA